MRERYRVKHWFVHWKCKKTYFERTYCFGLRIANCELHMRNGVRGDRWFIISSEMCIIRADWVESRVKSLFLSHVAFAWFIGALVDSFNKCAASYCRRWCSLSEPDMESNEIKNILSERAFPWYGWIVKWFPIISYTCAMRCEAFSLFFIALLLFVWWIERLAPNN